MEPPLGTISFFLLCMGFARELQIESGSHPSFSEQLKHRIADRLQAAYPLYAPDKVRDYAISTALKCDRSAIEADARYISSRLDAKSVRTPVPTYCGRGNDPKDQSYPAV